jgi:AcrR family transcriptional regulator
MLSFGTRIPECIVEVPQCLGRGRNSLSIRTPQAESPLGDPSNLRNYGRLKPGPGQSKAEVIASQRARLQRAIVDLAAQDGLRAVTVRRLTKLAGVSTAAFYSRFSGTDDCLLTTYKEIMAGATRSIIATRSPDLGPIEQLDRALRALISRLLSDRDISRFALIEIYEGGQAAIAAIGGAEARLASALRGCINRRGRRVTEATVTAIIAAVLHCARAELMDASPGETATMIDSLVEWAADVVEGREEFGDSTAPSPQPATAGSTWIEKRAAPSERDEEELLLTAILRLALPEGFRGLDSSKVSSAAGLPAARFRRHFATLADGYLTAIRRTSGSFFAELTARNDSTAPARNSIRAALHTARHRAAADPAAARLTFRQVIEPGVAGLTCREALISELALACIDGTAPHTPSMRVRAEARVAALREALAQAAQPPNPGHGG